MPRKIEYIVGEVEISDYEESHRYCNQTSLVEGIPLNPRLRPDFDSTPNDERDALEIKDWWNKPYIETCSWADMDETWESYTKRMASSPFGSEPELKEVFIERKLKQKQRWFNAWPSGTRYDVRCLNGGAWDRSLGLGMVGSLDEAVAIAQGYLPVDYGFGPSF